MNKRQSRYKLAVYLFLGSLAVILALIGIGFSNKNNASQSILLNLATEIFGFVILFFILERLFFLDEGKNYKEQIQLLRQEMKMGFTPLYWEDGQDYKFKIFDHLSDAKEIYLLGYSLHNLFDSLRGELPSLICNGLKVKTIIIDPNSNAFRAIQDVSISPDKVHSMIDRSIEFFEQIEKVSRDLCKHQKGSFEAKLLSWIPSCTMIIVRKGNNQGMALIQIQSIYFNMPPGKLRNKMSMIFHEIGDEREFEYFLYQFNKIWDSEFVRDYRI